MLEDLTKQAEILQNDLIELEKQFSTKKEQFVRIQGAIEALSLLEDNEDT